MRVFEAGCGSGGGGGVKENVEVSIFQGIDLDMEKLMDRKMKETVWVLSKGKERERWEKESVDISLPLSSKGMI